MTTIRKNIFTVCFEADNGSKVVYSAGRYFNINEGAISPVKTNIFLDDLAFAKNNFNLTEEGLSFYYDLRSKSIKGIVESVSSDFQQDLIDKSINAFNELSDLNENLSSIEALRKEHKLNGNEVAVSEANTLISTLNSRIAEAKKEAKVVLFRYVAEENKFYVNNREISGENLVETIFASGMVDYGNKSTISKFKTAADNFDKFAIAENVIELHEGNTVTSVIRTEKTANLYSANRATKLSTFETLSPLRAIDYISEKFGEDISFMFEDLLESKVELQEKIDAQIEEARELIAFLKDQRNVLAEANKNIPEIKEADNLVRSEISKFEKMISILEDDELTRNDGYTDGQLKNEVNNHQKGTDVKVDALDYTTSANDDMVTVMINGEPNKVLKRDISISSTESI